MKKLRIPFALLMVLMLLMAMSVPVFAQAPACLDCPDGQHEECTSEEVFVCDEYWPWWLGGGCKRGHTETVENCQCVEDDAVPVIPVTGGGKPWEWPIRTCADQANCVLGEDAEYTWDEAVAPPDGTMHLIYTSAEKFEWSYTDPLRNVLAMPGINGWWNQGADRTYGVAAVPFSLVDPGTYISVPSAPNDKAPGMQVATSTSKDPILLVGTFAGPVDEQTIEANRWREDGLTEGQPMRLVQKIFSCRGAMLDPD